LTRENPYYGQNKLKKKPAVKRASPRFSGKFSETKASRLGQDDYEEAAFDHYRSAGPGEENWFERPKQSFAYKAAKPTQDTTSHNWPLSGRKEGGPMGMEEWISIGHSGYRKPNTFENPARGPVRPHNVAEPVSYNQGRAIGAAIGGMAATCGNPDLEKAVREGKLSHADVLTQMGLNRGTASVVLQGLSELGLLTPNFGPENKAKAEKAQAVLFQVGGVACLAKTLGGAAPAAARPYVPYVPKAGATQKPPTDLKLAYRAAHGPKWFENDAIYAAYRAGTPPVAKKNPRTFSGALSRKDRNKRKQQPSVPDYQFENGDLARGADRVMKKYYYELPVSERPAFNRFGMDPDYDASAFGLTPARAASLVDALERRERADLARRAPPVAKKNPRTFAGALSRKDRTKRSEKLLDARAQRKPDYDPEAFQFQGGHLAYHADRIDKKNYYKTAERPAYFNYLMSDAFSMPDASRQDPEDRLQARLERAACRTRAEQEERARIIRGTAARLKAGTSIVKSNPQSRWPKTVGRQPVWTFINVVSGIATYAAQTKPVPAHLRGTYNQNVKISEREPGLWDLNLNDGATYEEFDSQKAALTRLAEL
jgi:hypothetical protein